MALFALPFILATSMMGQAVGRLFKHRETAILVFVATTLPQFFPGWGFLAARDDTAASRHYSPRVSFRASRLSTGWCGSIRWARNSLEVRADWLYLWLLAAVYFTIAVLAASARHRAVEAAGAYACLGWGGGGPATPPYHRRGRSFLGGAGGILLFLTIGSGVIAPSAPGLVHTTEIKIAPEISGRLARFLVSIDQRVHQGDDLVELDNPELRAALVLANAQVDEARAARDRVYAGFA